MLFELTGFENTFVKVKLNRILFFKIIINLNNILFYLILPNNVRKRAYI